MLKKSRFLRAVFVYSMDDHRYSVMPSPRRFPPPRSSTQWYKCHKPRNCDLRPGDNYSQASNNSELASTTHAVGYGLRLMSVLDDFMRVRDLRKRAAEYERAASDPSLPANVRTRYVVTPTTIGWSLMETSGQSALLGAQKQLVKYQRTTRLRPNKCSGCYRTPPLPPPYSFTHLLPLRSLTPLPLLPNNRTGQAIRHHGGRRDLANSG